MLDHILQEPVWLQVWVFWMMGINTLSLLFVRHAEGRWVLAAWVVNVVFMSVLFQLNGYNRLLGLSHVLFWTPLVIYLFRRWRALFGRGLFSVWIVTLLLTNSLSLVVDYIDVVRYLIGDGL